MADPTTVNRDLWLLCPKFKERVEAALVRAQDDGYNVEVFEGWRSPQRQDHLYAQGRSKPGKTVTNSQAWGSWHQFGLAVDIAFKVNGKWSWEGAFDKVAPYFLEGMGLEWAGFKGEIGHYQMTKNLRIDQAKDIVKHSGLQRLWLEVAA